MVEEKSNGLPVDHDLFYVSGVATYISTGPNAGLEHDDVRDRWWRATHDTPVDSIFTWLSGSSRWIKLIVVALRRVPH